MSARKPDHIDRHVGARLRLRRSEMKWSQQKLADKLGVTFQQVQKYERGTNRLGSSRLFNCARLLEVDLDYFFKGLDGAGIVQLKPADSEGLYDLIASPDGLALASAFSGIQDQTVRRRVIDLLRSISDEREMTDAEASSLFRRAA